jgi:Na+-driven multidrug efflux pump
MIAIALQGINGIVAVGEAIMVGSGKFTSASIVLIVASIGYTTCLQLFPQSWGINGVSISFSVFNLLRLAGFLVFLPSLLNQKTHSRSSVK